MFFGVLRIESQLWQSGRERLRQLSVDGRRGSHRVRPLPAAAQLRGPEVDVHHVHDDWWCRLSQHHPARPLL